MTDTNSAPAFATLTNGMTPQALKDAINHSGYPFQAVAATSLRRKLREKFPDFRIQEEWEYVDSESGQSRSVDILIDVQLNNFQERRYPREGPPIFSRLNMLVECKQSENPYIFFLRDTPPEPAPTFPEMYGPVSDTIKTYDRTDDGQISSNNPWIHPIRDALSFYQYDFVLPPLPYAISLAKAMRNKSKKVEVTGEETYRGLTYPLFKAVDHLRSLLPTDQDQLLEQRIFLPVAVVRAPMIGHIFQDDGEQRLIALPWVRVCRLEPARKDPKGGQNDNSVRYYDVVHESYLDEYIDILSTALSGIAQRLMIHSEVLRSGVGSMQKLKGGLASLMPVPKDFDASRGTNVYIQAQYPPVSLEGDPEKGVGDPEASFVDWTYPTRSEQEYESDMAAEFRRSTRLPENLDELP